MKLDGVLQVVNQKKKEGNLKTQYLNNYNNNSGNLNS